MARSGRSAPAGPGRRARIQGQMAVPPVASVLDALVPQRRAVTDSAVIHGAYLVEGDVPGPRPGRAPGLTGPPRGDRQRGLRVSAGQAEQAELAIPAFPLGGQRQRGTDPYRGRDVLPARGRAAASTRTGPVLSSPVLAETMLAGLVLADPVRPVQAADDRPDVPAAQPGGYLELAHYLPGHVGAEGARCHQGGRGHPDPVRVRPGPGDHRALAQFGLGDQPQVGLG